MQYDELQGRQVVLRPLLDLYVDAYLDAFSTIVRSLLQINSVQSEREYLAMRLADQEAQEARFYCIFDRGSQQLIGAIDIRAPYQVRGQLYCWLNEQYWGSNRFQEAITLATHNYFAHTGRHFLDAYVDISNKRSYVALKKAGFADYGMVRGAHGKQYVLVLRK